MKRWFKKIGLFVAGGACIAVGVLVPGAATVLGPVGVKLLIAAGAGVLVGQDPKEIANAGRAVVAAVKRKP